MAGVKIEDLNSVPDILPNDNFIVSREGFAKKLTGNTLFTNFSGVKNAISYGGGVNVYKGSITATNGTIGTTLQFNTLSGSTGINASTNGSIINLTLSDAGVTSSKIALSTINSSNIQANAIATNHLQNGIVTPAKQAGTLCDIKTKTSVQSWAANTIFPITELSAVVTPPTVNAKVFLTGTLSIGAANCAIILRKTINNSTSSIKIGDDTANAIYETTFNSIRNAGDFNAAPVGINFIDIPNTTLPVTYSILLHNTDSKILAYVNRGVNESVASTSFRSVSQFSAIVLP